jgi:hypothetical protein
VHWEGVQAVEECTDDDEVTVVERRKAVLKSQSKQREAKKKQHQDPQLIEALNFEAEESDDLEDSEDEYVEEGYVGGQKKVRSFCSQECQWTILSPFSLAPIPSATSVNGHGFLGR